MKVRVFEFSSINIVERLLICDIEINLAVHTAASLACNIALFSLSIQ